MIGSNLKDSVWPPPWQSSAPTFLGLQSLPPGSAASPPPSQRFLVSDVPFRWIHHQRCIQLSLKPSAEFRFRRLCLSGCSGRWVKQVTRSCTEPWTALIDVLGDPASPRHRDRALFSLSQWLWGSGILPTDSFFSVISRLLTSHGLVPPPIAFRWSRGRQLDLCSGAGGRGHNGIGVLPKFGSSIPTTVVFGSTPSSSLEIISTTAVPLCGIAGIPWVRLLSVEPTNSTSCLPSIGV